MAMPRAGVVALDVAYYGLALGLAWALVTAAGHGAAVYRRLASLSDSEGRARALLDGWLDKLSFGYLGDAADHAAEMALLAEAAARHDRLAWMWAVALGTLSVVFLGWKLWRWYRGGTLAEALRHGFGVSGVFLAVGLAAPMFTLSAFGDVPVLGRVVLSHEVKSVLSMIAGLADSGNLFVAALLALFSVVTPVVKMALSLMVLGLAHGGGRRLALATIHHVGRWSMTDVFVVAVLLAFLAANQARTTDAAVGIGLYFFAGYALLSLAAGHLLVHFEERLAPPARDAP
ncbi:MAG: paraquat-inducible protein A [Gammaproteobacteria bacterium]|nr:paraquat-inducible protein A [Gammaproteobacteria bacterium]